MKRIFLISLILIWGLFVFSQGKILVLHSVIGDTISKKEKIDYLLFPEINDSSFLWGQIHYQNGKFFLYSYTFHDTIINQFDSVEIIKYQTNIEKLNDYYTNIAQSKNISDSSSVVIKTGNCEKVNSNLLNPETSKKIGYDARKYQTLNNSANDKGLKGFDKQQYINNSGYGEIPLKRKKP